MIRSLSFLFFSSDEEACNEKDTDYDQKHSADHVAKYVKTEDQKDDSDDSEDLLFSVGYFPSDSDFASEFFAFAFEDSCFFFEIFCKSFCFEFYWFFSRSFSKRFSFSWHYAYM